MCAGAYDVVVYLEARSPTKRVLLGSFVTVSYAVGGPSGP